MIRAKRADMVTPYADTLEATCQTQPWCSLPVEVLDHTPVPDPSILIVESYAPNVRLFTELAQHIGFNSHSVSDLRSATEYLNQNNVGVIFLASFGSHASGSTWTRSFRAGTCVARRCPIIALSDCTSRNDIAILRGAGVSEIISTPINIDAFFDFIETYLVPKMDLARDRLAHHSTGTNSAQLRFAYN
jgi:DNA-binding response OmpR family regulator